MKLRLPLAICAAFAFAIPTLSAASAAAQGTMTPLPAPAPPPPAAGTPDGPPPAVAPAAPVSAPPAEPTGPQPANPEDGPPAHKGFQMAFRPGIAIPMGSAAKGTSQSDLFGPQLSMILDIGGKPIDNLFIGGYLGLGIGGAGGKSADNCDRSNATCTAATIRLGVQAQYHIIPEGKINPWVGYGIGIESSGLGQSTGGTTVTSTVTGWEFAHLMGGVDFRLSKTIGIGPVVDFSIAQYSRTSTSGGTRSSDGADIKDKTMHEWLTIGARLVLFP